MRLCRSGWLEFALERLEVACRLLALIGSGKREPGTGGSQSGTGHFANLASLREKSFVLRSCAWLSVVVAVALSRDDCGRHFERAGALHSLYLVPFGQELD